MKCSKISDTSPSLHSYASLGRKMSLLVVISLFLILLGFSITAQAADRLLSPDGRFEYILQEDDTAVIWDWIENSSSIVVPSIVDGNPVTAIGSYAFTNLYRHR